MPLGNLVNSIAQPIMAKHLQEDAQQFSVELARNKYRWAANDLHRAGLNRILAIAQPQATGANPGISGVNMGSGNWGPNEVSLASSAVKQAKAEANSAKHLEKINEMGVMVQEQNVFKAIADALTAENQSIMSRNEKDLSNARQPNRLRQAGSIDRLDRSGIGQGNWWELSGEDLRMLNAIMQRVRGRDQTGARD